mmetsp:Transcript_23778/g.41769  ORF Transcript_23778/g.41769 Transcript_23778/m.41769 type:complete len:109 (+) Transcript_23778:2-328(+)
MFMRDRVLKIRRAEFESGSSFPMSLVRKLLQHRSELVLADTDFVGLLQTFKEELGLRSPRSRETINSTYGLRFRRQFVKKPATPRRNWPQPIDSHYAFFLGSQLMSAI